MENNEYIKKYDKNNYLFFGFTENDVLGMFQISNFPMKCFVTNNQNEGCGYNNTNTLKWIRRNSNYKITSINPVITINKL